MYVPSGALGKQRPHRRPPNDRNNDPAGRTEAEKECHGGPDEGHGKALLPPPRQHFRQHLRGRESAPLPPEEGQQVGAMGGSKKIVVANFATWDNWNHEMPY